MRIVRVLTAVLVTCGILLCFTRATQAGSTAPTIAGTCFIAPAGTSTSQTLSCTVSQGQVVVVEVLVQSGVTQAVTPSGGVGSWSQVDSFLCHTEDELVTFTHVVGAGDTGSYSFSWGATPYFSHIDAWVVNGADTGSPVDAFAHVCQTGSATATTPSQTPTTGNSDLPLAAFGNSNNNSPASSITSGWTEDYGGTGGGIYLESQHGPATSSATNATITYTSTSSPLSGIVGEIVLMQSPSSSGLLNQLTVVGAGGPHQSIGITPPSNTYPAKMLSYADTGGSAMTPTNAQAKNWFTYLQDINLFTGNLETICTSPCELIHYMDFWKSEVSSSGQDTSFPFHSTNGNYNGTCPGSSGANFFTAGIDDETWYLHANGTSSSIGNRIASFLSQGATYVWMMNPGSTTLQTFIGNTVANCYWSNNGNIYAWSKHHVFLDNTKWRISMGWSEWGTNEYTIQTNIGTYVTGTVPPYAAGSACTTTAALYGGSYCSSSTQLTTNGTSTLEYGSNDASYISDANTLLSKMKANSVDGGACVGVFFNGYFAADDSILSNSCVLGGVAEKVSVDSGSHGSQGQIESLLDGLALANHNYPTKRTLLEDTSGGTGTQAIGNAAEEFAKRMHYATLWVGGYDNVVDQPYLDSAVSGANYIFPATYLVPQWDSAYQTMAAPSPLPCGEPGFPLSTIYGGAGRQCTSGGAHDTNLCHGTFPNCFYVREFPHCSYNANFDNTTAGTDMGPCAVGLNLTGGSVSAATFASYFAHWSSYSHIISFCGSPNSSYITSGTFATGTTVVGTGCGDVANGGGMDFSTLLKSSFTGSLAQYDAIFLVQ